MGPIKKTDGSEEYYDPAIPGATLIGSGYRDNQGNVGYKIRETSRVFLFNTNTNKYYEDGREINPGELSPFHASVKVGITESFGELILLLQQAVSFVKTESKGQVNELLAGLKAGKATLDDLERISQLANEIYAQFDHKIQPDEKSELSAYRIELMNWAKNTQKLIYTLRNEMLINNPDELKRYSLTGQYKKKFPHSAVPAEIAEIDQTLGTVIFGQAVLNDCGKFAQKLFNLRRLNIVKKFMDENLSKKDELSLGEAEKLLNSPGVKATRHAVLIYKDDPNFPYPHHAKTSLAQIGDQIYTLEAHTGKPFLLAPELQVYGSREKFLEMEDIYVGKRTETWLKDDLAQALSLNSIEVTEKERYRSLSVFSDPGIISESFGKQEEDFKKKDVTPVPAVKLTESQGKQEESEEIRMLRESLNWIEVRDKEKQNEIIAKLAIVKEKMGAEFNFNEILKQWGGLNFKEDKYQEWVKKNT